MGIDVDATLLAAACGKSSCASKEVEQRVPEEEEEAAAAAALPNPTFPSQHSMPNPGPPSPSRRSMPDHEKCIGAILDEPDTIDRLNNISTPTAL